MVVRSAGPHAEVSDHGVYLPGKIAQQLDSIEHNQSRKRKSVGSSNAARQAQDVKQPSTKTAPGEYDYDRQALDRRASGLSRKHLGTSECRIVFDTKNGLRPEVFFERYIGTKLL
ncbi:hypothetical protein XPA_005720 [Xanthoria parietina]